MFRSYRESERIHDSRDIAAIHKAAAIDEGDRGSRTSKQSTAKKVLLYGPGFCDHFFRRKGGPHVNYVPSEPTSSSQKTFQNKGYYFLQNYLNVIGWQ